VVQTFFKGNKKGETALDNEKQLARQPREKKFRRRFTTLFWAVPVFAFFSNNLYANSFSMNF
jgi:hypothetical protein